MKEKKPKLKKELLMNAHCDLPKEADQIVHLLIFVYMDQLYWNFLALLTEK